MGEFEVVCLCSVRRFWHYPFQCDLPSMPIFYTGFLARRESITQRKEGADSCTNFFLLGGGGGGLKLIVEGPSHRQITSICDFGHYCEKVGKGA